MFKSLGRDRAATALLTIGLVLIKPIGNALAKLLARKAVARLLNTPMDDKSPAAQGDASIDKLTEAVVRGTAVLERIAIAMEQQQQQQQPQPQPPINSPLPRPSALRMMEQQLQEIITPRIPSADDSPATLEEALEALAQDVAAAEARGGATSPMPIPMMALPALTSAMSPP